MKTIKTNGKAFTKIVLDKDKSGTTQYEHIFVYMGDDRYIRISKYNTTGIVFLEEVQKKRNTEGVCVGTEQKYLTLTPSMVEIYRSEGVWDRRPWRCTNCGKVVENKDDECGCGCTERVGVEYKK